MRTYQRLVIAKGSTNISFPHNFLVYNETTHAIKISETGIRYDDIGNIALLADDVEGNFH